MFFGAAALLSALGTAVLSVPAIHGSVPFAWPIVSLLGALGLGALATIATFADREAERVRRALAAGMSHDIRTPLAQIAMFTEMLLLEREGSEDERRRWLRSIERETGRLCEVTENLLLYVHGANRDPCVVRRRIDFGALVEDVAACFASRAATDQMVIAVDSPSGVWVMADPHALRQVVVNLLDSALRFGSRGQTVVVELDVLPRKAILRVTDDGPPLSAPGGAVRWSRFARLKPLVAAERMSGLGMAVTRQIVDAHRGRCRITDSTLGGVRVQVELPTAGVTSSTTQTVAVQNPPAEGLSSTVIRPVTSS
jgi:signal transduction histidine kinase